MKKWKKGGFYGSLKTEVLDADGQMIAAVRTKRLKEGRKFPVPEDGLEAWPEGEANLALILAAPDLLEVLGSVEWVWSDAGEYCPWCGNYKSYKHDAKCPRQAVIAKVKGANHD